LFLFLLSILYFFSGMCPFYSLPPPFFFLLVFHWSGEVKVKKDNTLCDFLSSRFFFFIKHKYKYLIVTYVKVPHKNRQKKRRLAFYYNYFLSFSRKNVNNQLLFDEEVFFLEDVLKY
jgi:hypothetical protein